MRLALEIELLLAAPSLSMVQRSSLLPPPHACSPLFFRPRLVCSFVYERGWRQGFVWAGFPGPDKEFELAMDYLQVGG